MHNNLCPSHLVLKISIKHPDYVPLKKKFSLCINMHERPQMNYSLDTYLVLVFKLHVLSLDFSFFIKHFGSFVVILLLYVDDIILTCNNSDPISQVISSLTAEFELKDFSDLHYSRCADYL